MQQPWPACRSAKGGLYTWSQSTPNSIILERVSCVSSTERLFTCAEPRCYFASPSVFIMMALFCLLVGEVTNMPLLDPVSFCPMCFLCSFSWADNMFVFRSHLAPCSPSSDLFLPAVSVTGPLMLCCPDSFIYFWMIYNNKNTYQSPRHCFASVLSLCVDASSEAFSSQTVGCCSCFMCILWRMLPKQDMPNSVDQPRALGHHCFFSFHTSAQFLFRKKEKCSWQHWLYPFCVHLSVHSLSQLFKIPNSQGWEITTNDLLLLFSSFL